MNRTRYGWIFWVIVALGVVTSGETLIWAQGKKPDTTNSESKQPSHPVKSAKDGANEALDNLDTGVHKAGSTAKAGAEKALDAVDEGVHKVVGSSTKQ